MADLKDPQTWQGLGGLYEIFAGVMTTIFGGVWFAAKLNGRVNAAHTRIAEVHKDVSERITGEVSRIDKQRAEDLGAAKDHREGTSRLLSNMDAKLDRLIERMLK